MEKKENSVKPFKEHLKKILLKHSFMKIIEFEIVCIVIVILIGFIWGAYENKKSSQQVSSNIEQIINTYEVLLNNLGNLDDVMVPKLSSTWQRDILKELYSASNKTEVHGILYIIDLSRNVYVSNQDSISEEEQTNISLQWKILDKIKQNPQDLQIEVSKGKNKKLFMGKGFVKNGNLKGYLVLKISNTEFNKILGNNNADISITDSEHWILLSKTYPFIDEIGKLKKELRNKTGLVTFKDRIYYSKCQPIPKYPLLVYSYSDYTDGFELIGSLVVASFLVIVLLFWIGRSNVEKVALEVSNDIQLLNEAFLEVGNGNLDFALDIHSSTEFENIGNYFNEMRYNLKKQMIKNKELAEEMAYAQTKHLRSQFKSHFLFNTLDNIRFICKFSPDLADNIIVLLSKLLRYNTTNQNEKVTISEDFAHLKMYFEIIQVRFRDSFTYHIDIEDSIKNCLVIKSLVQPLVENSIKYGLEEKEHIEVIVSAKKTDTGIQLICKDNGNGINPDKLQKIQNNLMNSENKTIHLGLYNINRRVQLTYGNKYGLILNNNHGLLAQINLPQEME